MLRKPGFLAAAASLALPVLAAVLAKGPRRIQMNLLRNLSADEPVTALVDGLKENNSPEEMIAVKAQTGQLVAIMKGFGEVKEGNGVTPDFVDGATAVGFNGVAKGTIPGEPFNRALTKVWLREKPVQADLKKAMLGG